MTNDPERSAAPEEVHRIYVSPAFRHLEARRSRLAWWFTGVAVGLYVAFFIVIALAPGPFGDHVAGFGSIGILVVVALFVVAFAMVASYLRITSRSIVAEQARVTEQLTGTGEQR